MKISAIGEGGGVEECDKESGHITKLKLSNPAGWHNRYYEYDVRDLFPQCLNLKPYEVFEFLNFLAC